MYKTHSSLQKSLEKNHHSRSMNNFVLLNPNRQVASNYQWKPLNIKQALIQRTNSLNREISFGPSYSHKKSILLTLNQPNQNQTAKNQSQQNQSPSKVSINGEVFRKSKMNLKQSTQQSEHKTHDIELRESGKRVKMQQKLNKFTSTTTFFNQKVENNIRIHKNSHSNSSIKAKQIEESGRSLYQRVKQASEKSQRVIAVLTMKRYGLRIRLKHCLAQVCMCSKSLHQSSHRFEVNQNMNRLIKEMLSISVSDEKPLYYFHLNKEPMTSSNELPEFENVILASTSPVVSIDNDFHFKVYEEADKINFMIRQVQQQLAFDFRNGPFKQQITNKKMYNYRQRHSDSQSDSDRQTDEAPQYDWQKIPNIHQYVQQIVEDPSQLRTSIQTIQQNPTVKDQIQNLYNEKFDTIIKSQSQTGQNFRNPLLQDHSHYHLELKQKKILSVISAKLQDQKFIKNNHILKRPTIEALIEQDKREKQRQAQEIRNPNIINRNIRKTQTTKKSLIRLLDSKNPLLFQQNIPYMLNKYGINRYEIHNLFTIYKTLQKISAMKFKDKDNARKIMAKGIDRSTFDEGLKRLDINPGDEVIKNICYFDDFISWEHFLKIVSIGLRKTPEQKLEAILIGIGGTSNGFLSKNQISLMIGNSLNKIFDSEQAELREYFTQMAMKDLDGDGSGTVDVSEIKSKCLSVGQMNPENGETMDLITFLLLNS